MELSLTLREDEYLTREDKQEIDKQIDKLIEKNKSNVFEINRLVFDSVTALTASESRASELSEQGMFKRFWGGVTGKNQKIQSEIDRGLARAQYSSQQTLQKLAEQNLMSFELITAVNNKLNSSIIEIESEINNIYSVLVTFFKQIKSDLIQLENRVKRLEQNVNLLNWHNTIEYQIYAGKEYSELKKVEKIFCLVSDFYQITDGNWNFSDVLILKSTLSEIGVNIKENITYAEFGQCIVENTELLKKLIDKDGDKILEINGSYIPAIYVIFKRISFRIKEKYIIDLFRESINSVGIEKSDDEIENLMLSKFMGSQYCININKTLNIFDFVMELICNIKMINHLISEGYASQTNNVYDSQIVSIDNNSGNSNKAIKDKNYENIEIKSSIDFDKIRLYAGSNFGAIIDEQNELFIWGNSEKSYDLIGNIPRSNTDKWIDLAIGKCPSEHSFGCCGVNTDNKIVFWKTNRIINDVANPKGHKKYLELSDIVQVSIGQRYDDVIALDKNGKIHCYAHITGESLVPYNLENVIKVLSDGSDFYALCGNGRVYNWCMFKQCKIRFDVSHWRDIKDIATDRGNIIAVNKNGNVLVAGNNSKIRNVPKGLKDITAVSMGSFHAIALDKYGEVHVWGSDHVDSLRQVLMVPQDVKNIVKIAAGSEIMIALDVNGKVHMWGYSEYMNCCIPSRFCV